MSQSYRIGLTIEAESKGEDKLKSMTDALAVALRTHASLESTPAGYARTTLQAVCARAALHRRNTKRQPGLPFYGCRGKSRRVLLRIFKRAPPVQEYGPLAIRAVRRCPAPAFPDHGGHVNP